MKSVKGCLTSAETESEILGGDVKIARDNGEYF